MPIVIPSSPSAPSTTSLSLGRVILNGPLSWQDTNGAITVVGNYKASSITDGLVKRDQILGLANNFDEPIIPVIMADEPRLTGYYRVIGSSFTTDEFTKLQGNLYNYQVDLERVMGFTQPLCECIVSGALLSNAVGAVGGNCMAFHATTANPGEYVSPIVSPIYTNRVSADGTLTLTYKAATAPANGVGQFFTLPVNFYTGAATFQQGNPLMPAIGRTMIQRDIVNWQLSNGLVSIAQGPTVDTFNLSWYHGGAWTAVKQFDLTPTSGGTYSVTVLRNSVEEVAIRIGTGNVASSSGNQYVDLVLRRGDAMVRGYAVSAVTATWGIQVHTAEAATAITYGAVTTGAIGATATDAAGIRYMIASYQAATTSDLINGKLSLNSAATTFDFAIGADFGSPPSATPNGVVDLAEQYIAALSESQRIVAR